MSLFLLDTYIFVQLRVVQFSLDLLRLLSVKDWRLGVREKKSTITQ